MTLSRLINENKFEIINDIKSSAQWKKIKIINDIKSSDQWQQIRNH